MPANTVSVSKLSASSLFAFPIRESYFSSVGFGLYFTNEKFEFKFFNEVLSRFLVQVNFFEEKSTRIAF